MARQCESWIPPDSQLSDSSRITVRWYVYDLQFAHARCSFAQTFVGCDNHWRWNLGWTVSRSEAEFAHLRRTLPPHRLRTTRDRVSGAAIDWVYVDLEEYGDSKQGSRTSADAVETGARGSSNMNAGIN